MKSTARHERVGGISGGGAGAAAAASLSLPPPHAPSRASSHPKPTPEWLLEWRAADAARRGDAAGVAAEAARVAATGKKNALVSEECPKCKNPQMEFWTMQTRSADEGQTVFYKCPACAHMFSVNT